MNQTEELLYSQIERAYLPVPVRDLCFYPPRNWTAKLAWSKPKLIVQIDEPQSCGCGSLSDDRGKFAMAAVLGYRVIHFTPEQVENESALTYIQAILREDA
jgi:hypothetical protein